jgi:uncharacterized protein
VARGYRPVQGVLLKERRWLIMPTWDESKRRANLRRHKLDFVGIEVIGDGFTVTREDVRERYGERRFVTFGVLHDEVVVMVYTERRDDLHVISLRRAEKYEKRYYLETAEAHSAQTDRPG